jgi:hypothetical protein
MLRRDFSGMTEIKRETFARYYLRLTRSLKIKFTT